MTTWVTRIFTIIALGCLSVAAMAGDSEFYELRIYRIADAAHKQQVLEYIDSALLPALERMNVNQVGVFTVAEVGGEKALKEMKDFTHGDDRLNSAYSFVYCLNIDPLRGFSREFRIYKLI